MLSKLQLQLKDAVSVELEVAVEAEVEGICYIRVNPYAGQQRRLTDLVGPIGRVPAGSRRSLGVGGAQELRLPLSPPLPLIIT